nr:peptide-methionine (S)-S-oxide reductase MsrA [Granulosicoccus sp.]
ITFEQLLQVFWESHDPTEGMRQGNDVGTQYRSGIYATTPAQYTAALASRDAYQQALNGYGRAPITTEILDAGADAPEFFFAEDYHQQYLHKNPGGYCNLRGTGVKCVG